MKFFKIAAIAAVLSVPSMVMASEPIRASNSLQAAQLGTNLRSAKKLRRDSAQFSGLSALQLAAIAASGVAAGFAISNNSKLSDQQDQLNALIAQNQSLQAQIQAIIDKLGTN